MTPEQILAHLESAGYDVARRAFRDAVHYMRPAGTCRKADLAGRQYSIDLASGQWNRWGHDGLWHPLAELPQLTIDTESTASLAAMMGASEATFVGKCVKQGFVLDDTLQRTVDFGNRFARWTDGRRYLLCESAGQITDCATGDARGLETFIGPTGTSRPSAAECVPLENAAGAAASSPNGTLGPATEKSVPPPRPFISMRERPLQLQGATVQTSLF